MCGIAGFFRPTGARERDKRAIASMTDAIVHRGPDSYGHWQDEDIGVAMGMRRLAILDLSSAGAQPMTSADGRYIIVFNGEIYNFREVRARLDQACMAPNWRGHSDTEVLLAAICAWGLSSAVQACNGMFAFALWDRKTRTLNLAIDRFGEKPLFYGWMGGTFLFGSELKALMAHPDWAGQIDRQSLALFFRFAYVPAPHCIFRGLRKMEPGTIVALQANPHGKGRNDPAIENYWSAHDAIIAAQREPLSISEADAVGEFDARLADAVRLRMESDVPLGAFLSGGFDSSAIVAMMQRQSAKPVRTFSIGFTERGYDEAPYARAIAKHLKTDHTELYVTPREAMDVIPKLPEIYDEPFADSSQIPTFLVAQLARRHVTVALSGDGGDELLGGYARYFVSNRLLPSVTRFPFALRQAAARGIVGVGADKWDAIYRTLTFGRGSGLVGDRALKFAALLAQRSQLSGYRSIISNWQDPAMLLSGTQEPATWLDDQSKLPPNLSFIEKMMLLDTVTYLPGDILTKVDRATMAVSLEGRVPFLDPNLLNFVWRLPLHYRIRGMVGKWLLRQTVYRYIPPSLIDRPKTGFGIPLRDWLNGPLKPWASAFLQTSILEAEGISADHVMQTWKEHQSGTRNAQHLLWPILMFLAWKREYADRV